MNRRVPCLCLALLLCAAPAFAAGAWGPWEAPPPKTASRPAPNFDPLKAGVRFFQTFISPVDGPRCPMAPTCSAYALQALEKHGPLVGAMMTVDRLFHETDSSEHRHPVSVGGRVRYADPVENNDFWFAGRPPSANLSADPWRNGLHRRAASEPPR